MQTQNSQPTQDELLSNCLGKIVSKNKKLVIELHECKKAIKSSKNLLTKATSEYKGRVASLCQNMTAEADDVSSDHD